MILFACLAATLGFLLPVLLFVGLRMRRGREPWEIGLDIPLAVSGDLLVVLCLAFVMRLGMATLVSRAAYGAVSIGIVALRRRRKSARSAWPSALGVRAGLRIGCGVLLAAFLSVWISRTYVIWDRGWHIPLVTSMLGQKLPFKNVLNLHEVVHYHFAADVQAAMLQALSLSVLHSSLALSLLHDLHFALTALVLGCFLVHWGYRRAAAFVLGTGALLLTGPTHLFREGIRTPQEGHSYISFLSFSFRPATGLSALLILGFAGAIVARIGGRDDLPLRKTAPPLCACAAALAITDETSLGLLGLTLGLTWLYAPRIIHERRAVGLLVFLALLAALVLPNLAFSAALAPGSEHHAFALVPWRSPGYYRAVLPLTTYRGRLMLVYDMLGPATVGVGAVLHVVLRRRRGRALLGAFFATLLALSLFLLTRADIDRAPSESHRFVSAAFLLGPFVALALMSERFAVIAAAPPPAPWRYSTYLMAAGLGAAACSTLDWGQNFAPTWATTASNFGTEDLYHVNCRTRMGARAGTAADSTYVASSVYYLASGCIPMFTPGYVSDSAWKSLTIGLPLAGDQALAAIRKDVPAGAPVPAICPTLPQKGETLCARAAAKHACHDLGTAAMSCVLDGG